MENQAVQFKCEIREMRNFLRNLYGGPEETESCEANATTESEDTYNDYPGEPHRFFLCDRHFHETAFDPSDPSEYMSCGSFLVSIVDFSIVEPSH
jgi:hypothetical protein